MARIVGVDLPKNKRGEIGLTYVYGIGRSSSRAILDKAGIDYDTKVKDWTDEQVTAIRNIIASDGYRVEGELRSTVQLNIKRLMDIAVSATVLVSQFVVKALKTMLVHVRVARRP